jgi:hypothetical protein
MQWRSFEMLVWIVTLFVDSNNLYKLLSSWLPLRGGRISNCSHPKIWNSSTVKSGFGMKLGWIAQLNWWKLWVLNSNDWNPFQIKLNFRGGVSRKSLLVASWRNHCSTYSKSCDTQYWVIRKTLLSGSWLFTVPSTSSTQQWFQEFGQ